MGRFLTTSEFESLIRDRVKPMPPLNPRLPNWSPKQIHEHNEIMRQWAARNKAKNAPRAYAVGSWA
jgi:hypothetical protein